MSEKKNTETLAFELDRTKWDYSPSKDRSFLLNSVERMFASVAWEIAPQHLTPVAETASVGVQAKKSTDHDTQPLAKAISGR